MSHINLECSTGMVLICLFQMGSGYFLLGGNGDLDLPPSSDVGLESLLPGGTLSYIFKRGCGSFPRSLSGSMAIHTNYGSWLGQGSSSLI